MTREESIEVLKHTMWKAPNEAMADKILQATGMAIQALSQEPTEKPMTVDEMEREYEKSKALFHKIVECDDAVSRDAVLKIIDGWYDNNREVENIEDLIILITYMQAVQPKRQTGKWILLDECANSGYYCSECHKKLVKEGWSQTVKKIKYCPNCGADMREEQTE